MIKTLKKNPRMIAFGVLTAFFSGPGQTFLISIFVPHLENHFHLSQTKMGSLYAMATLTGSILLPYLGRLLDRISLVLFTAMMAILLAMGCLTLSLAQNILFVFLGLSLIRSFGQGAMTLTASTTTARFFTEDLRGKALSWASLGHPLASMIFPISVSFCIDQRGWRNGWVFLALLILVVYLPTIFLLLKTQQEERKTSKKMMHQDDKDLSKIELWSSPVFIPGILVSMIMPGLLTSLFLYQALFGAWKGWSLPLLATAFAAFSFMRALISFAIGKLIDRFSAKRLFAWFLTPFIFACFSLYLGESQIWAFVYLGFCGLAVGTGMVVRTAFWTEIYGHKNLGMIKGYSGFFGTLSTAICPPIMGILLDKKIAFEQILIGILAIVIAGNVLAIWTSQKSYQMEKVKDV